MSEEYELYVRLRALEIENQKLQLKEILRTHNAPQLCVLKEAVDEVLHDLGL